ncbi:MAG TPA: FAD:protein FMN transferase [Gemmataceae bacterium]
MHRRKFIRPNALARQAGLVAGAFREVLPEEAPAELALVRASRGAMATVFEISLPLGTPDAVAAAEEALDLIDRLEDQLSVFRPQSEVSRLNAAAPYRPVRVEENLFALLERAAHLNRQTHGAFDVATGALTKAWGFYRRQGRVPPPPERAAAMARTGMRHVLLDRETRRVRYRREGVEINLGAIGKGYALDRAAAALRREWGVTSALLHSGRSSARVIGAPPGAPGWRVDLTHPWREGEVLGTLLLRDCGLGTSAATYQYFEYNGRKLGHLLDPRTGRPAEGTALASVVAPTAELADALSTAFFVLGEEGARRYCAARPEVGAVLLPEGEGARPVALNLDSHRWRPAAAPPAE